MEHPVVGRHVVVVLRLIGFAETAKKFASLLPPSIGNHKMNKKVADLKIEQLDKVGQVFIFLSLVFVLYIPRSKGAWTDVMIF
jgi:hypothetical protein